MEKRYKDFGGQVHYRQKVEKILVQNDKAGGVEMADGSEHRADIVISNVDGRKTITEMLGGISSEYGLRMAPALFGNALSGRKTPSVGDRFRKRPSEEKPCPM